MSPALTAFALGVLAASPARGPGELCPCSRDVQTVGGSGMCADCTERGLTGRALAAHRAAHTRRLARLAALAAIAA